MKLIINERQYRLLIENENGINPDGELFEMSNIVSPFKWDKTFLRACKLEPGKYSGYYINGVVDVRDNSVKEFKHLVGVDGDLQGKGSKIESLGKLEKVTRNVNLSDTKNLKSLGNLKYVGFNLDISDSNIEDLGHLNQVGRDLDLRKTENLKSLGKTSSEFSKEEFKIFVGDFLMIYKTGLSDEQIDNIKHNWLSKAPYGN